MDSIIELNVGTDFDISVLNSIIEMNEEHDDVKVTEVYGSLRSEYIDMPSARPDFRLSDSGRDNFEEFIRVAGEAGISINYTSNASFSKSVDEYNLKREKIVDVFKYLESVGVKSVIIANPLLIELVSENTNLKIKVSTILGVNKASAIKHYANSHVNKICADIYVNRNIPLLKAMQDEAFKYDIDIELLANEICLYGDAPCSNVLRSSCYTHSSLGGNKDKAFNNWPFERCQRARQEYPICWLKIPYILPQYLKYYKEHTGIRHFKITGRTNTHEYLLKTLRCYMDMEYDGSIPELFMLPQNISNKEIVIGTDTLTGMGFFDNLLNNKQCDYNCESCGFCDGYADKLGIR